MYIHLPERAVNSETRSECSSSKDSLDSPLDARNQRKAKCS